MKHTVTIFVATTLLIAGTVAEDPWTPSPLCPFPSTDLVRFQYEGDCSKYWECYNGARYPMDCPAGLEYNSAQSRCDTPSLASCDPDAAIIYPTFAHSTVSTQSPAPTEDWGPRPNCPSTSNELTFFPVATNCAKYWACFQGVNNLMDCPAGLQWNTVYNYCDYPENVDCTRNVPTTSRPTRPTRSTAAPENATTPASGPQCPYPSDVITFYPDPADCSKYYKCYQGVRYLMPCPDGLLWNEAETTCDYKKNVNCNRDATTTPTPTRPTRPTSTPENATTPASGPQCPYPSDVITFYPDPADCSKYYKCYQGVRYLMPCPDGLLWNEAETTCDYKENVNCNRDVTTTPTPTRPTRPTSTPENATTPASGPQCPYPSDVITFYPDPADCSKYYKCYQGVRYLMPCPDGLLWNEAETTCDYKKNVNCNRDATTTPTPTRPTRPTSTPENATTPASGPQCPYPSDVITFYPDPADCSKYYKCYQGVRYLMPCPDGLLWNEAETTCDYKENVNCNRVSTISPPTAAPTAATTINPTCVGKQDGTYLPNPNDCRKFYECVGGKIIEEKCAADLLWNDRIHTCDYPENVSCKN